MQNAPPGGHTAEFEQLAGLSSLGVLEGEELARWRAHSAACERCRLMVRLDRQTLSLVSLVAPPMDPTPDFKERLMRRAAEELAATAEHNTVTPRSGTVEPTPIRPRPPNVQPFYRRSPWLSALAAVFVAALVSVGVVNYENQTVASFPLTGRAPGSASVVVRRSGAAELDMSGVPNPDPGLVYEAWIIPRGQKPIPVGVTASGDARLKLSGDLSGATIAITEERGLVDAPSSDPIMAVVVQM